MEPLVEVTGFALRRCFMRQGRAGLAHLALETDRMTIDVDTDRNIVWVRQRWSYLWITAPKIPDWTLREKRAYHGRFEAAVLRAWNNRATLRVIGSSPFAKSMACVALSVRLDIQWVLSNPHWTVTVKKIPAEQFDVSKVNRGQRRIWLDTNDLTARRFGRGKNTTRQVPVAHEYGHSFGNVPERGHGDEYRDDSPYKDDNRSIINVGGQLRARHFDHLLSELNRLVPATRFVVGSVR